MLSVPLCPSLPFLWARATVRACVCAHVTAVRIGSDTSLGALKAARVSAGVLVGFWSPLSHDQMGLGHLGTQPEALNNIASPAMCEHLFSSIKTVIWIFQLLPTTQA